MIGGRRFEHRVRVEPLHRDLRDPQHKHIRRGQSAKPVREETQELEEPSHESLRTLGQSVQISLGVRSEVEEADEQAAHEEEGVDAEGAVLDRLEEEALLHDLAVLHVVRVLEDDDAGVAEDHPGHRDRPQTVNRADGVATYLALAYHPEVGADGEREQQFFPDGCWNRCGMTWD